MPDYVTPGGLLVRDHRRASEIPQIDPRLHSPNGNTASSVGPESTPGSVMHPESWDGWPSGWATPWYGPEWSGEGYGRHSEHLWGRVSTAMSCVDLNSRELASFPVYGMKNTAPIPLPSWSENPEPEMFGSWAEFMHATVNSLELRGDAFFYVTGRYAPEVEGVPGRIARFTVLNPDVVDVEFVEGRMVYTLAGAEIPRADVCHVRFQSWPGRVRGIAPIEWVGRSLVTAGVLERYASGLASRGGVPWAVIKSRGNVDKLQAETIQGRWVEASVRRDGAPAVMGGDLDLQTLTLSPKDMSLLELREFDERRICAAFGVPAFLVNVATASSMTYSNVSQVYDAHWRQTLRPLAQLIAACLSAWLLPRGSRLEFNADRYTQPPLAERAQAWATLHNIVDPRTGARAMEVEEIRSAERLLPVPNLEQAEKMTGGDDVIEQPVETVLESVDIKPDRIGTIATVVQALAMVAIAIILAVEL